MDRSASTSFAITKDTVVDIFIARDWNALDDGSGNNGQEQESESDQE
jgi:hypothetical protein